MLMSTALRLGVKTLYKTNTLIVGQLTVPAQQVDIRRFRGAIEAEQL